MADVTRNSRMSIVRETTEGTPVSESSGSDFINLQEGFEMTPSFNVLENEELTGSIGKSKSILGLEEPSMSLSHYLRHEGTEATEPNYGLLIEAVLGAKSIRATERDTVAGSTVSVLNVDAGEGVDFSRGDALLVKNGAANYEIRNVKSVLVDALTLNFDLDNAPASGVNLGRNVKYSPADDTHPTLSVWLYRGNGGDVELSAGTRITEMSIDIPAAELINASFNGEGISFSFNPIEITATTNDIDFTDDVGAQSATLATQIFKDPHEAAAALQSAMDAQSLQNITVVYVDKGSDAGKFITTADGTLLSVDWATTVDTLGAAYGYTADDSGGLTYTSDVVQDLESPFTPVPDTNIDPLVAKNNDITIGDQQDNECISTANVNIVVGNEKTDIMDVCAESGKSGSIFSEREIVVQVDTLLEKHDVDKWRRFRENETTEFMYNGGVKVGGNWVAGRNINMAMMAATISEFSVVDRDGLVALNMTLTAFVDASLGEFYLNFL